MKSLWSFGILIISGCANMATDDQMCIKGKLVDHYCNGLVIKILDNKIEGRSWKGIHSEKSYQNSLVASFDTTVFSNSTYQDLVMNSKDSIFYFKFREGGYPRQTFEACEPAPFVTVTFISANPCIGE